MEFFELSGVLYLSVINLITLIAFGLDKLFAVRKQFRVSEKALLLCALCLGAIGAYAGMKVFRHKTRHIQFKVFVPIMVIFNLIIVGFIVAFPEIMAGFS